jgi:3-oxoacyl-[acyl-carrier protein] reductase
MLNVLVTGGSRGLGLCIAEKLVSAGFCVISIARNRTEQLEAAILKAESDALGELHFRAFDLMDTEAMPAFVKSLTKEFGILFGLVNNAGIGTSGVLATMPDREIEQLIRLNILSPIIFTKYVVRSMMGGRGGRIVNISSVVAATGYNGLSVYSATKASFAGFTRSLAREVGPLEITVNTVAPGFIDTDMTHDLNDMQRNQITRRSALRRMPVAGDVSDAVNFLFSEGARNITGTTLTVDAGNTA